MTKKMFAVLISVFTAAASAAAGLAAFGISAKSKAQGLLSTEISDITASTETVSAESEKIQQQINEADAELGEQGDINGHYMEYKKTHDNLTEEISGLRNRIDSFDKDIEAKKNELGEAGNTEVNVKKGRKYALKADESYACPDKIPAGRYIAEGEGQLTVLNSSGMARISQNLTVSYDHTYTFDLSKGEKVQVSEDITLTELK